MNNYKGSLVFVHDHKFRMIGNKMYSTGGLSDDALRRYTNVFGKITVISRVVEEEVTKNKYSEIKSDSVEIINGANLTNKEFESIISESSHVISRMPSLLGFKAIKIAQKCKKPYLIEVVGCVWDALWNHSKKGKLLALPSFILMKQVVRRAKYVLYVTEDFLQRRYPTEGKTVNCSNVALREFDDRQLKDRLKRIKEKNSKVVLGTTAAIDVRYKGQQYIIEALGRLKKEGIDNFEYQLVGGGDKTYLQSIAEKFDVTEQVNFLGAVPHTEVFDWLKKIDIYVQPSKQEGLPRALIEAMSKATPAFGSKTAGIPELLESEFIFSNTKNNINEICNILKSFDKNLMLKQSVRNYEESKKYDHNVLENRRTVFFTEFKTETRKEKLVGRRLENG